MAIRPAEEIERGGLSQQHCGDSVTLGLAPRRRSRVPFGTERLEHDVGAPLIPLNRCVIDRLSGEGYGAQKSDAPVLTASPIDAVARSVRFHRWGLGFRQCSFRPIARALRGGAVGVFGRPPLLGHAVVPSGFRPQVNPTAQEHPSGFLLAAPGIQHRVPRRTVSPHTAPRSTATLPRCDAPEEAFAFFG